MKKKNFLPLAFILLSIGGLIFVLIILYIAFDNNYFQWNSKIDLDKASKLGDFLSGIVGVLWSAAGVLLIYSTFHEQQKLNSTQKFENSFFNLLSTYHQIVNNTSHKIGSGREFFSEVLCELKRVPSTPKFIEAMIQRENITESEGFINSYRKRKPNAEFTLSNLDSVLAEEFNKIDNGIKSKFNDKELNYLFSEEFIKFQYEFVYSKYQEKLGHYFRFIFHLFKYTIDEREELKDRVRYINLIQAQMSNDELGLLFYHAFTKMTSSNRNDKEFFDWLDKYTFFKNINENSLIDKRHTKLYPNTNIKFDS